MAEKLKAPFPYFGGKSKIAPRVWELLGNPGAYAEPFAGSLATLLARPGGAGPVETVNDADGLLANFWRAMTQDPAAVADAANWPVNEVDLHARHLWLVGERERITGRLMANPDWFDAKAAGWWVWGCCCWIGGGWCSGDGPWTSDGTDLVCNAGQGINRKLPHLGNAGRGINRKLPHLGDAGRGINRKLPHLGNAESSAHYWLGTLADRLKRVRVACGDWSRVVGSSTFGGQKIRGVFLDPPYSVGADLYATTDKDASPIRDSVQAWCLETGADPNYRIVLCGYDGEYDLPGWQQEAWEAGGSYAKAAGNHENAKRERLWISPGCIKSANLF